MATPPLEAATEYAVYVALKLDACERRERGQVTRPPLTARWVHALLDRLTRGGDGPLELQGVTSHFVRERLRDLNHGTALQSLDVAGPQRYAWTEVLSPATLNSYRNLRQHLQGRVFLALDLARLKWVFEDEAFTLHDFVEVFRTLRESCVRRRWYELSSSIDTFGPHYTAALVRRLDALQRLGLVTTGPALRLTPRAMEACHWFQLVVHSVEYPLQGNPPRTS